MIFKHGRASSAKLVPLDQAVAPTTVERFLRGKPISKSQGWPSWPLLENKQQRKFDKFKCEAFYPSAVSALRLFVETCIPDAPATEVKFWLVTLLPPRDLLLRVNAGQQEVFTLHLYENEVVATILAQSRLDDESDPVI